MRYLKTFENFGSSDKMEVAELASEILSMAGEDVSPQEVVVSVEDAAEGGEAQSHDQGGQAQAEMRMQNESVMEFLNWWWDLLTQTEYVHQGTSSGNSYELTLPAYGAWLATLAAGGAAAVGTTLGIKKIGKAIKGIFNGKEVDFTEFVDKWSKQNGIELTQVDLTSEEGKQIMSKMYTDFKKAGGKI